MDTQRTQDSQTILKGSKIGEFMRSNLKTYYTVTAIHTVSSGIRIDIWVTGTALRVQK